MESDCERSGESADAARVAHSPASSSTPSKDAAWTTLFLDADVFNELSAYAGRKGVSTATLINEALRQFIGSVPKRTEEPAS
jgi:uncharacterized protein (DUF4415 family)